MESIGTGLGNSLVKSRLFVLGGKLQIRNIIWWSSVLCWLIV
jgi:hypothetical protein